MISKIKKNYVYNISYQLFALLVPLITTPYISRILQADGVGVYSFTYSIVRYFWLLSALGISTYGMRIIGTYQDDKEKRSQVFWELIVLKSILSVFFIILYILYVIFLADNKLVCVFQGINLIAVLFDITWLFQGMEEFGKVSLKNLVCKILNVVFIFVFIKNKNDLALYAFGMAFFQLLGNLSLWIQLKEIINKPKFKKVRLRKHLVTSLQLFIPSIAAQIFSVLDKSMIGWITKSSFENGYYEQSLKIVDMILVLVTTMSTVTVPRVAKAYKENNLKEINDILSKSFNFVFFISIPMIFGLIAVSSTFVPIFFGEGFEKSVLILNILSVMFLIMGINSIIGTQYLVSTNQQLIHTKYLFIGGIVNIILNIILISRIGAVGAAIASVVGELTIGILELHYLSSTKQVDVKKIFINIYKYLISACIMYILVLILLNNLGGIFGMVISVIIGIFIYGTMLIIFRDKFFLNEIKVIVYKLKKES